LVYQTLDNLFSVVELDASTLPHKSCGVNLKTKQHASCWELDRFHRTKYNV
jgi:hypothetical protein